MLLKQIKRLGDLGRYQEALVNYMAYAFFGVPMKGMWEVIIPKNQTRLKNKLNESAFAVLQDLKKDYQIDSYTSKPVEISGTLMQQLNFDSTSITWWRLDFVARHLMPEIAGKFVLPLNLDGSIKISIPFKDGEMATAIFFTRSDAESGESTEGVIRHKGVATAFSMCPLSERQAIAQLIELFVSPDLYKRHPKLTIRSVLEKLFQPTANDKIQDYVKNKLGLSRLEHTDSSQAIEASSGYKQQIARLVTVVEPTLSDLAGRIEATPHDQPTLKTKSQLGSDVNYNIEGIKSLGGLIIVHGWIVDPLNKISSIKIAPSGTKEQIEILHILLRFERPDVLKAFAKENALPDTHYGFVAVVDMPYGKTVSQKISVIVQTQLNKKFVESFSISNVALDTSGLAILTGIIPETEVTTERCEKFYRPLFDAFTQNQPRAEVVVDKVFATTSTDPLQHDIPELSVIIPFYGDTRFELTQIPLLAKLRKPNWEVIFAVDDLNILNAVIENSERLASNYGLSVRVVAPNRNLGFSGINNFSAARARGKMLLFLNSDCFITTAKPLAAALEWLKDKDNGAAGFRLHYADNTIQHDGMSVALWQDSKDFYLNDHPRIGASAEKLSNRIVNDSACMLTAACLMVEKKLFHQVGGFDTSYLRGDFEDSDLCLKLISKGKKLGIVRDEGIYHLERQSISDHPGGLRQLITLVNSNIYSHRWKQRLAQQLPMLEVIQ